jgi:hypothetical protein
MRNISGTAPWMVLALAAALGAAGCHSNQDQNAATTDQSATQNMSEDPANANVAPVSDTTTGAAAPAPTTAQSSDASYESTSADSGEEPVASAPQPPPQLPEYSQPACPSDGYIWTPGYWNYQPTGYFWVPGVWVHAPYVGALWTPPYWGFSAGVYHLFPGYWGPHIGFYGGINYGFGYTGFGYQGGYWNAGHFSYNVTVNNINRTVIHNVYSYKIVNVTNVTRVSYNGGHGGIVARPRPQEIAALREPRAPRMATQIQHVEAARVDHAQFETVNHGRPERPVVEHPIEADRDVHPEVRPVPHPEVRPARPEERRPPPRPEEKRP